MSSTLEATDRQILQLLAADGRMSFTDLGKATGLSTSAVHQRVKRLEQRGLILGYGATVNHDEIGLPLTAFISIRPIDPSEPDDSPARLEEIPEIESCWSVAGDESYILKVRLALPERPRGAAGPHPGRRQRLDPHHHRAVDLLREPSRHRRADGDGRTNSAFSLGRSCTRCRATRKYRPGRPRGPPASLAVSRRCALRSSYVPSVSPVTAADTAVQLLADVRPRRCRSA